MKIVLQFLLVLLFPLLCLGQNVEFKKTNFKTNKDDLKNAIFNIKIGDKLFFQGPFLYKQALAFYMVAQEINPDNAILNYKIGKCLLSTNEKTSSIPYLEKAYRYEPQITQDIRFLLGRAYHYNFEFDKAIVNYKAYREELFNDKAPTDEVEKKIKECQNGKDLVANPVRVFIDNLGSNVNSHYPEYGPVISADESILIFTSRRDNTTGGMLDEKINQFYEDIYISNKVEGKWSAAENIGYPINTEDHDATVGLSPDGQKMIIYKGNKGNGDLYVCELIGDNWSKPFPLPGHINTKAHESSACFSPDGRTLFFISDRTDLGYGGHDIYMSRMDKKGKWGKPENLGTGINSPYDEESVYMHPDGKTIYFSSKGHNTMGGHDIFRSVFEDGKWSKPVNVGYPINTPDDDVFFVVAANGRTAYYSSFRNDGEGEKDIFKITFLGAEKHMVINTEDNLIASVAQPVREVVIEKAVEIPAAQITLLKGIITDAMTQKPLEAEIELVDNLKNEVLATFKSNSKSGKYLVSLPSGKNYGIAVKAEGYLFHSENFDIPAIADYQEVYKDVQLKNVAVGSKIVLRNIFFDTGKYSLRPESTNELERLIKLLNDVPTLKIEISGHTDNRGSTEMNQVLSQNRAKAVVEYLIANGINKDRLEFAGYGLTQPVATNDTDAGRQENRRTEFKILSR
jgi:outer membrane protein OmpA-like peptidoglycan-associated protein/Tol biopolymer transport system component